MSAKAKDSPATRMISTFLVADHLYGIHVTSVQEVTRALPFTEVPLAPAFVKGLINLRGQISTAIDMRELFRLPSDDRDDRMAVVCRAGGNLVSLLIDEIGDVIEVSDRDLEAVPEVVAPERRRFLGGVYKLDRDLLTIVDVRTIFDSIDHNANHPEDQTA